MAGTASKSLPWALLAPALMLVGALIAVPTAILVYYSLHSGFGVSVLQSQITLSTWIEFFTDSFYAEVLLDSLRMAFVTTLACLVIGYIPAFWLSQANPRWRGPLMLMLFLPMWIPYIVRTMSWISVLGRNGVLNTTLMNLGLIEQPLHLLYTDASVYIGLVHFTLPLMVLNIYLGLQSVDRNVVDAARTLGANSLQAFVAVTLPLSLPGVLAGSTLCFILAMGAYVTPMLLGGPGSLYYPKLIYETVIDQLDWPFGAVLSLVLIALLSVILLVYSRFVGLDQLMRGRG